MKVPQRPVDPRILLLSLEAFFGSMFVILTRGLVVLFLLSAGLSMRDIFFLNCIAGFFSLILLSMVYRAIRTGPVKNRLIIVNLGERITWFTISLVSGYFPLLVVLYSLGWMLAFLTGIYLNILLYSCFTDREYSKLIGYRNALGAVASIFSQILSVVILAIIGGGTGYRILYVIGFLSGLASTLLIVFSPLRGEATRRRRVEEEVEVRATTMYILALLMLTSMSLLNLAWIPRLRYVLEAPDYVIVAVTMVSSLSVMGFSLVWSRLGIGRRYVVAFALMVLAPILISTAQYIPLHFIIAVIYGVSVSGINIFIGSIYGSISRHMGTIKTATLLASINSTVLLLTGLLGLLVVEPGLLLYISSILTGAGLLYSLIVIHETAVIRPDSVRLYSRIIYNASLASYNYTVILSARMLKIALTLLALLTIIGTLFIIYRILYYLYILTH